MSGTDYTQTPNLGLYKPTYNADAEQWGNHLNSNADVLDRSIVSTGGGTLTGPLYYTATGGTVPRSAQDRAADVANVLDYGADPTGVADSTAAIQAAISAAGEGVVSFPVGTYLFNQTLVRPGGQVWRGATQTGTALKWTGANNVNLIATPTDGTSLYGGINDLTIDMGTAAGCTALAILNSNYGSYARLQILGNDGLNNRGMSFIATTTNSGENSFYHCTMSKVTRGVYMTGTPGVVATLQSFQHLSIILTSTAAGTGIEFDQWADSHYFYYTRIMLAYPNSIGLKFHTTPPSGNPTVYDINFYGLAIDGYGSWTGSTGFWINRGYGIIAKGVFNTMDYPDLLVTDINADQYDIECVFGAVWNSNVTKVFSKGTVVNDLSCPRVVWQAGQFYRTASSGPCVGAAHFAGSLWTMPIALGETATVKTLSLNVTAPNAGSATHYRLGIYADNGGFAPGHLVAAANEMTVAAGATGVQTSAVLNAGAGARLARGIYWLMFLADVTGASVSSIGGAAGNVPFAAMTMGADTAANAFTGNLECGWYAGATYGPLPDPAPTMLPAFTTPIPAIVLGV